MKHLYIIGNGFDIHHGRSTNYLQYRQWLEDNDEYSTLTAIDDTFGCCDSEWWAHFEENLASANTLEIAHEEAIENYPNVASDDFSDGDWFDAEYAVENRLNDVYDEIRDSFQRWICQMKSGDPNKKVDIDVNHSLFLTFNYSDTLESLYGVPKEQILYIHGKANTGDELMLGHGASKEELEETMGDIDVPSNSSSYNNDDDDDYYYQDDGGDDMVVERAKQAAVDGVYKQRKDVEGIINRHSDWFKGLADTNYIHIFGHSFGDVDLPYFRKVLASVDKKAVEIEVSDFQSENKATIQSFMKSEGIKEGSGKGCYHVIELSDIQLAK